MRRAFLSRLTIFCILTLFATFSAGADPPELPPSDEAISSVLGEDASPLDRFRLLDEAERQVTLRILDRPVEISPTDGNLIDALYELSSQTGLDFIYDVCRLRELGIDPEIEPVDVDFGEEPIRPRDALDLILSDLGLAWNVQHGRILITSIEMMKDTTPIRLFDITELAGSRPELEPWIELITETIEPESWDEWGGAGVVSKYETAEKCFMTVSNNRVNLKGVESLLTELHRLNVPANDRPLPAWDAPNDDHFEHEFKIWNRRLNKYEIFTARVYDVSRLAGNELQLEDMTYLVQDVVEMNEWEPRGGPGSCAVIALEHGDFFVAWQTSELHFEVASFFTALEENDLNDPRIQAFEEWKVGWEERREEIRRREAELLESARADEVNNRSGWEFGQGGSIQPPPPRPPLMPRVAPSAGDGITEEQVAEAARGANQFAFDFYNQFVAEKPDDNLFFAPIGISTAFAMPYMASVGQTASQMRDVFHYPVPPERIGPLYAAWALATESPHIPKNDSWMQLANSPVTMANGLWIDHRFSFRSDFLSDAERYFGATAETLDFGPFGASGAANVINQWCEQHTNGVIPHVVDSVEDFDAYLANAIYFEAYWSVPFPKAETDWNGDFYKFDGERLLIPLMTRQDVHLPYTEHEGTQIASLSYEHPEFEMILMLPPDGQEAFTKFEASLDAELLDKLIGDLQSQLLNLWLPRFEVGTEIEDLSERLSSLGMPYAFGELEAEFPGVLQNAPFNLDASIHKAVIKVSEEKTVAAAFTGMGGMGGMMLEPPRPIDMRIDRPFILAMRHRSTGSIIFMGRIIEPKPFLDPDY